MENELFGKNHEQEENGLFGKQHAKTNQLIIGDVSGSYFELEFGNHLRAKMIIEDGKMKVVSAVNGWGDGVPLDEIDFVV